MNVISHTQSCYRPQLPVFQDLLHCFTLNYSNNQRVTVNKEPAQLALVLQQNRLCWYGHVLRKEDDDWVKKCMEYELEGPRPRGRPKRTWREVIVKDVNGGR